MSNNILKIIDKLRFNNESLIKDIGKDLNPHISKRIILERQSEYTINNVTYHPAMDTSMVFIAKNLPYQYKFINENNSTFSLPFKEAVESGYIYPILFFLNNKFIKWSDITLIRDYNYSFILINKYENEYNIDCIEIPYTNVKYEENVFVTENKTFMFNINDKHSISYQPNRLMTYLDIMDDNLIANKIVYESNTIGSFDSDYIIETDNIICFNNGYLFDCDKTRYGMNIFSIDNNESNNLDCIGFYNKLNNDRLDNYTKIYNQEELKEIIQSQDNVEFCNFISQTFNYEYDKPTVSENVSGFLDYIYKYNPLLLNDIYRDLSTISIKKFSGLDIIRKIQYDGFVYFSRNIVGVKDSYLIILINGKLYDQTKNIIYNKNMFKIDPIGIHDTDIIEFIFFNNIDNREFEFYMYSGADTDTLPLTSDIDVNNIQITSQVPFKPEFEYIDINEDIMYPVPFHANRDSESSIKLILDNPVYYDKRLLLSSKLQFRTYNEVIRYETNIIELPSSFRTCNSKQSYLVYINNTLIPSDEYELITFDSSRPVNIMTINFNITLIPDDVIDIIYTGINMNRITLDNSISNIIHLDKSKLLFPYSKDLYHLYINGIKIDSDRIIEIDSVTLNLLDNYNHINTVELICMVDGVEILTTLFRNNSDLLTKANELLSEEEKLALYGGSGNNINNDNIQDTIISDIDLARMVINKHWNKPFINTGDEINMTYDKARLFDGIISND